MRFHCRVAVLMICLGLALFAAGCGGSEEGQKYDLEVTVQGSGNVQQSLEPKTLNARNLYDSGRTVRLTPIADEGWAFSEWQGDLSGNNCPAEIQMNRDKQVTAIFVKLKHNLNIAISGEGTVTEAIVTMAPDRTAYDHGDRIMLTPIPATGWEFSHWSGDLTGSDNPAEITLEHDMAIEAVFALQKHSLSYNVTGNGLIAVLPASADGTYDYGTVVQLSVTPGNDSVFSNWEGDASGWDLPLQVTMDGDKQVTAVFTLLTNLGAPQNTHPSWAERTILVFANMARMAPAAYRTAYLSGMGDISHILVNYPAVPPMYWHYDLNRAARYHAEDLAANNLYQHNSSNGTSWEQRVAAYYTGEAITELLAAGSGLGPSGVVNLWLYDSGYADGTWNGSTGDGYRYWVMSALSKEAGVGYGYNASTMFKKFWVLNTGAGTPASPPLIIAGSHDFIQAGTITFALNYYDPSGQAPRRVQLVLDGVKSEITLGMGAAAQGTYTASLPTLTTTRRYYFIVTDSQGRGWRYPGPGTFWTVGEGTGTMNYS